MLTFSRQRSAPEWQRLFARVNALGWHVEVHREAVYLHAVVGPLLAQGCTVVVDHFGRPNPHTGAKDSGFGYLLSMVGTGRVWIKLSAAYRSAPGDDGTVLATTLASQLLDAYKPDRVVWGSDRSITMPHGARSTNGFPTRRSASLFLLARLARCIDSNR